MIVLQVLRYGFGQQYKPHMDSLSDDVAGPRLCTILLYLNGGCSLQPDVTVILYNTLYLLATLYATLG
jgi:hypothetical protein